MTMTTIRPDFLCPLLLTSRPMTKLLHVTPSRLDVLLCEPSEHPAHVATPSTNSSRQAIRKAILRLESQLRQLKCKSCNFCEMFVPDGIPCITCSTASESCGLCVTSL